MIFTAELSVECNRITNRSLPGSFWSSQQNIKQTLRLVRGEEECSRKSRRGVQADGLLSVNYGDKQGLVDRVNAGPGCRLCLASPAATRSQLGWPHSDSSEAGVSTSLVCLPVRILRFPPPPSSSLFVPLHFSQSKFASVFLTLHLPRPSLMVSVNCPAYVNCPVLLIALSERVVFLRHICILID